MKNKARVRVVGWALLGVAGLFLVGAIANTDLELAVKLALVGGVFLAGALICGMTTW